MTNQTQHERDRLIAIKALRGAVAAAVVMAVVLILIGVSNLAG